MLEVIDLGIVAEWAISLESTKLLEYYSAPVKVAAPLILVYLSSHLVLPGVVPTNLSVVTRPRARTNENHPY